MLKTKNFALAPIRSTTPSIQNHLRRLMINNNLENSSSLISKLQGENSIISDISDNSSIICVSSERSDKIFVEKDTPFDCVSQTSGYISPKLILESPKSFVVSNFKTPGQNSRLKRLNANDSFKIGRKIPSRITWKPKKSVHWKTNIATWIQMTTITSNYSDTSDCDERYYTSEDDNDYDRSIMETSEEETLEYDKSRKNSGNESITSMSECSSYIKHKNSMKSDRVDYAKNLVHNESYNKQDINQSFDGYLIPKMRSKYNRNQTPLPAVPGSCSDSGDETDSHYYSKCNSSCDCEERSLSPESFHTYARIYDDAKKKEAVSISDKEDVESINSSSCSSHTYCEIEEGRTSRSRILGSILQDDAHLEGLQSTVAHQLPDDDVAATALLACRLGDLEYLQDLKKQGRINPTDSDALDASLLHYAARGGHINIIRFLIEDVGCSAISRCSVGATPLHDAAALGHLPALQYLFNYSSLSVKDNNGATVLHVAAR